MGHPGRLGQLGRAHRRLEHRLDHHVARIARLRGRGVLVHQLGQDGLVERAPVDPDPDRDPVVIGDADDRREVLVVALGADVARVDPVLGERGGHLRVLGEELVPVVVEVTDDRHVDAQTTDLADHLGDGGRGRLRVDRHAHELRARVGQTRDLDRRPVRIGRVGVGHRLDDDRVRRPDQHAADVDADGRPATRPEAVGRGHGRAYPPRLRMMSKPVTQMMNANRNTNPTM